MPRVPESQRKSMEEAAPLLREVVQAGEQAGFWTRLPAKGDVFDPNFDRSHWYTSVHVLCQRGCEFSIAIQAGHSWDGKVTARVAAPETGGFRITVPEHAASVAVARGPGVCAAELDRRVIKSAEAQAAALRARHALSTLLAQRQSLQRHVTWASAKGYSTHAGGKYGPDHIKPGEANSVRMYGEGKPPITVKHTGVVQVNQEIEVHLKDLNALLLLAANRRRQPQPDALQVRPTPAQEKA